MARESPQSPHPKFNMRVAAYMNVSALGCTQTCKFAIAHRSPATAAQSGQAARH